MLAYVVGLFFVVIAGYMMAIAIGWDLPYNVLVDGLLWIRVHPWESLALAVFLLLIGLIPYLRPRKTVELSFSTSSKWGEVRVAMKALSDIISRSAQAMPGVRQVQPVLRQREDGLEIILNSQFNPEFVIPETAEELQTKVKDDVERYTGIKVAEVKVLVCRLEMTSTAQPTRLR